MYGTNPTKKTLLQFEGGEVRTPLQDGSSIHAFPASTVCLGNTSRYARKLMFQTKHWKKTPEPSAWRARIRDIAIFGSTFDRPCPSLGHGTGILVANLFNYYTVFCIKFTGTTRHCGDFHGDILIFVGFDNAGKADRNLCWDFCVSSLHLSVPQSSALKISRFAAVQVVFVTVNMGGNYTAWSWVWGLWTENG